MFSSERAILWKYHEAQRAKFFQRSLFDVGAQAPGQADTLDAGFEERVKSDILTNPEIILEALDILPKRETRSAVNSEIAKYLDLFSEAPVLGMGPKDPKFTVVEFLDYWCEPCKALHPKLKTALENYPNIRVEMRHLPILSPGSERGARCALAVRNVAEAADY